MLTHTVMGVLALAILWVNTLLVAAATGKLARALLARRAEVATRLTRGRVVGGALAVQRIAQIGRAGAAEGTILFHDTSAEGDVLGGALSLDDGAVLTIEPSAPSARAEVWLTPDELARAAACPSVEAFDAAYATARKAKGFARTVEATVGAGRDVFVVGELHGDELRAALVATVDPRALLARKAALALGFVAAELALAAACTAIALWPPVFGRVSTVGGVLCLGFFLLVQPASTALRDAVLVPSRAPLRGTWTRAKTKGA